MCATWRSGSTTWLLSPLECGRVAAVGVVHDGKIILVKALEQECPLGLSVGWVDERMPERTTVKSVLTILATTGHTADLPSLVVVHVAEKWSESARHARHG